MSGRTEHAYLREYQEQSQQQLRYFTFSAPGLEQDVADTLPAIAPVSFAFPFPLPVFLSLPFPFSFPLPLFSLPLTLPFALTVPPSIPTERGISARGTVAAVFVARSVAIP